MSDFLGKKLIAWDEEKGQFEWVSPRISTKTVYDENGQSLDEILAVSPAELVNIVQNLIANAPEEYDTLQEIAKALSENKDSIGTILREISKKIDLPDGGSPGQVLKLNADGKVVFGSDEDTTYVHPATHSADMIIENQYRRFITDQERLNWNGKLNPTDVLSDAKVEVAGQQIGLIDFLEAVNDFLGTKGQAGGIAELDGAGKVPSSQLPPAPTYDLSPYATKSEIPTELSQLNQDGSNRLVTDMEKTSWNNKVDKETGKGLSTNDYTTTEKNKLSGIQAGAEKNVVTSVNGQTGSITLDLGTDYTHPTTHPATMITESATKRFVTDTEKSTWNNKQDKLTAGTNVAISGTTISATDTIYDDTALRTRITAVENREDKDTTYNVATTTTNGLMSSADKTKLNGVETGAQKNIMTSADKTKLDGIEAAAQKNTVTSVQGRTGAVSISKSDVGLGSVNNVAITQAQVTKINELNYTRAMTQAQYDALSQTEKDRVDVWYGIYK